MDEESPRVAVPESAVLVSVAVCGVLVRFGDAELLQGVHALAGGEHTRRVWRERRWHALRNGK